MIQFSNFLNEGKYDSTKLKMEKYFNECSKKYFSEFSGMYKNPVFVVKEHVGWAGWFSASRNEIGVVPELSLDDNVLKSTIFHETIHFYQDNSYNPKKDEGKKADHGRWFISKMEEINKGEGVGFVRPKEDAVNVKNTVNSFWVYGIITKDGMYAYIWTPNEVESIDEWINGKAKNTYAGTFKFQTNDYYYKTPGQQYKKGKSMKFGGIDDKSKIEFIKGIK